MTNWPETAKQIRCAALATTLPLTGAIVPAVLAMCVHCPLIQSIGPEHALTYILLVVAPFSSFMLAAFIWRTRLKMLVPEALKATAIPAIGIDPLSGLPNRLVLDQLLDEAIGQSSDEIPTALIAIDIDRFKSVNDSHGHQAGDKLIIGVSERLKRIVREKDCVARVGGDEFVLMIRNVGSIAQCSAMVHRIHDAMLAPFDIGRAQVNATISIGIAICPQDGDSRQVLTQAADLALYRAKEEGRNRFAFFDKTMEQKLRLGMTIEGDLRAAINNNELSVLYQPLMASCGTRMVGLEALVRWNHPRLGMMSPEEFIPVAETRGLIAPLGEWVLSRACSDARRWPGLRMAVNVSPVQFRQRGFVQTVKNIIESSGIEPGRLDLELTEGVLIQDADQAESIIIELRALGVRMGIDDFGSGYSSMIYLRRFAFDKIKIDRAFLGSIEPTGESAIILESIVSLGHALGRTVTAEGIEHKEQVDFLQELGCDEMQGYFFAPPLPADEIDARLSLEVWEHTDPTASKTIAPTGGMRERTAA